MQESRGELKRVAARSAQPADGGAPAEFEEAYLQLAPRLRKIAMAKFGIAHEDAEGLVQDVFATFFMHASSVEQPERYLIGAICNASRKHLQRNGPDDVLFCDESPCAAVAGDVLQRQIERKQLLARVFARIGSRCRELLGRYYFDGESTAAIAGEGDTSNGPHTEAA